MNDIARVISTLFVIKAKPKRKRNDLLDAAFLAGASLVLLSHIRAHQEQIETLVERLYGGRISPGQFRSQFEKVLGDNAVNAYAAVTGKPLTKSDKDFVREWVKGQSEHIRSFMVDHLTDTPVASAVIRVPLWASSLGALGSMAFIRSNPTVMGTWHYGDTIKHCTTCGELNGKSEPLSYYLKKRLIPQEPGSKTLSCGGWHCLCTVVDSISGKVLLPFHLME